MKTALYLTAALLLLSGCNHIPPAAHFDRGSPYALLDASSEVINISLHSSAAVQEAVQWMDRDQPTQAELYCLEGDAVCGEAISALEMFRVPVQYVSSADNLLVLVYDRVVARNCENRYIDNPINPYNLSHPAFGCSLSVNMVQMVGDKRQFVSPSLLDFRDGVKAVQDYELYLRPHALTGVNERFDQDAIQSRSQ